MADTMEALGIARGDYVIRVNNRKVLDGVMEAIGLGGEEHAGHTPADRIACDRQARQVRHTEGVRLLLGEGRKDESGDFTARAPGSTTGIDRSLPFDCLEDPAVRRRLANKKRWFGDCRQRTGNPRVLPITVDFN